jgi:hypothetical protein
VRTLWRRVAAISPDGAVWPCVFSRWLPVGNVLDDTLAAILAGTEAERVRCELAEAFAGRDVSATGKKNVTPGSSASPPIPARYRTTGRVNG